MVLYNKNSGIETNIYIDTVNRGWGLNGGGSLANSNALYVGCDKTAAAGYLNGVYLDCIAAFNKVLSAEEIGFLYNAGNGTESLTGYEYRGIDRGVGRGILRGIA